MTSVPQRYFKNILLADDHEGDRFHFKNALKKIPGSFNLTLVSNGVALMDLLNKENERLPDILFIDLIMPLKDGFECLSEIKSNKKLEQLNVIIFSTLNCHEEIVEELYKGGAQLYVHKPKNSDAYKTVISKALLIE